MKFDLSKFAGQSILVYDLEIIKCIAKGSEKKDHRFQYAYDFRDFQNMGVSVIAAYDFKESEMRVFCKGNFGKFRDLVAQRDEIVGFNSQQFDDNVLKAAKIVPDMKTTYDIMQEIMMALKTENFRGLGLDNICQLNGVGAKYKSATMRNGGDAPKAWQLGQIGEVIDYCMRDTLLTARLFTLFPSMGTGKFQESVTRNKLRTPKSLRQEESYAVRKKRRSIDYSNPNEQTENTETGYYPDPE